MGKHASAGRQASTRWYTLLCFEVPKPSTKVTFTRIYSIFDSNAIFYQLDVQELRLRKPGGGSSNVKLILARLKLPSTPLEKRESANVLYKTYDMYARACVFE